MNKLAKLASATQLAWVFTLGLTLAACAAPSTRSNTAESMRLFVNARPYLGKKITIKGYLRYEFENRNLFPLSDSGGDGRRQYCLPILIERGNKALLAQASQLNGKIVTITGTIVDPTPPGLSPLGVCKAIGFAPDSIEATK